MRFLPYGQQWFGVPRRNIFATGIIENPIRWRSKRFDMKAKFPQEIVDFPATAELR